MNPDTPANPEPVATGDRRDEVWLEPDKDQLVRMRATFRPEGPLPPEEHTGVIDAGHSYEDVPLTQDVAVVHSPESVWDARPADDEAPATPTEPTEP